MTDAIPDLTQAPMFVTEVQHTIEEPPGSMRGTCSSCGVAVWWVLNDTTGGRAPIEREPVTRGNVVFLNLGTEANPIIRYHVLHANEESDAPRYRNHFQTCRDADRHGGRSRGVS